MTHVYYHSIEVTLVEDRPTSIRWRGITYCVSELNEPWHLMDRWWASSVRSGAPAERLDSLGNMGQQSQSNRSDRTYYRLRCTSAHEDLTCDIYYEAIGSIWILERVYD